ncbi:hypothetical protein E2562_010788 [Oryza meyeriana var. granulata]|uniref:Uncharacterized protein n=1 Tax=Oryza meyeriana var. granulata TaxID=110450 RepID=A0A6G1BK38_9ORYZ|nr:hypothetical protein E2562_010788 [Oryza meyeriana var. granulata]
MLVDGLRYRSHETVPVPLPKLLHMWPPTTELHHGNEAIPHVNVYLEVQEATKVLNAIKHTIGMPSSLCVTIYIKAPKPWHGPCLKYEARNLIPEEKFHEIWECCATDNNTFFWSMLLNM